MNTAVFYSLLCLTVVGFSQTVSAQHQESEHEQLVSLLTQHAFTHLTEVEWESAGGYEIEGFTEDGWVLEMTFDRDGETLEQERERGRGEPWGLPSEKLEQVLQQSHQAGIVRFDELEVSRRGVIEVEGYDRNEEEIEITFHVDEL